MVVRGRYCIINGELKTAEELKDDFIVNRQSIYEVIRIKNNKPLFFHQHIDRLFRSAALTKRHTPDSQKIYNALTLLIIHNEIAEGNIEIIVNDAQNWSVRFIPHQYPKARDYKNGVKTHFYEAFRDNPNAKVKRLNLKKTVSEYINKNNIYEVIYVYKGLISEGSRSNIFFIKDQTFYTPPVSQILPGITREVVCELIEHAGYHLIEKALFREEAFQFETTFLTGTSPGVLPVEFIDNIRYNTHNQHLHHIMSLYNKAL